MLDAEFNAHLGDFGLARLVDHQKVEKTTMMAGTLGYMAPEIPYTGKATKETDVYSFGVLVLEVVCGRHPVDTMSLETEPEDVLLVNRVRRAHDAGKLLSVVDPRIAPLSTVSHFHTTSTMSAHAESKDDHLDFCEALSRRIQQEMCIESEQKSLVLRLGLLCSLPQPSARPSMRIVKQVLSSGDATLLPPLPPSFPFTGSADELYPHFLLSDQAPLMTEQSLSPHSSSSST
jgi:interleukin-1 receptor-associated kinase 1